MCLIPPCPANATKVDYSVTGTVGIPQDHLTLKLGQFLLLKMVSGAEMMGNEGAYCPDLTYSELLLSTPGP
jgi:hypothetical protein